MRNIMLIAAALIVIIGVVFAIMEANKPVKGESFDTAAHPTIGQAAAPIKMVEFGDFKCPSCKIFTTAVYPQLKKDFIDTGKVQLSFYNFPFIAPDSMSAAVAAQSVYHQNKDAFWTYYDSVFNKQPSTDEKAPYATTDYLVGLAKTANLPVDFDLMKKDIDNLTYQNEVNADLTKGKDVKVTGTPTLFINGVKYAGSFSDYAALKAALLKVEK